MSIFRNEWSSPVKESKFVLSAPTLEHCPNTNIPEICLSGRSNVGKSSFVNRFTNRLKLAKTSNTPGKTRQMNYFLINDSWHLVDLPGYGYAKVSKSEQERWAEAFTEYLRKRTQLRLSIVLCDIRHKPQEIDLDFIYWLASQKLPFAIVLNKLDKIPKNKVSNALKVYRDVLKEMNVDVPLLPVSSETGVGYTELYHFLESYLHKAEES
ncbi:MAG: ribosome biogenesis GTP-binding protein YihA/YsxC [Balneolales bacterium]|nr:ribosome biogenesis GTP-binding protein YihA/YsxC [Balneolales bacterium]